MIGNQVILLFLYNLLFLYYYINNRAKFEEKAKFFTKKYARIKDVKEYPKGWDFTY